MDEVSLLIDLVSSKWSSSVSTLVSAGTISADHAGTPNFVDVRTLDKNSIKCKQLWIQRNLKLTDSSRIHLVRRSEKRVYANGNVLIDDYGKNTKEWKNYKGIPIKHKSASSTISSLRKLGFV